MDKPSPTTRRPHTDLKHLATEATDSSLDDIDLISTLEAAQRMNALDRSGNRMVDVRATNEELVARSFSLV